MAHPGHELRVFHWMERMRPLYCCLTEGSGGAGSSRMPSTDVVLERVGSRSGPIYGRYSDKEIYGFLLAGQTDVFVALVEELAEVFVSAGIDEAAGDAVEGFNPSHDVCRFVIDGAIALAGRRTGRPIDNRDFVLEASPDTCPEASRDAATWLRLDDAALDRKIDAALQYPELRSEAHAALERFGRGAFAVECLRPAATAQMLDVLDGEPPTTSATASSASAKGAMPRSSAIGSTCCRCARPSKPPSTARTAETAHSLCRPAADQVDRAFPSSSTNGCPGRSRAAPPPQHARDEWQAHQRRHHDVQEIALAKRAGQAFEVAAGRAQLGGRIVDDAARSASTSA